MAEKAQRLEHKASGHIAPAVKMQRNMLVLSLPLFIQPGISLHGMGLLTSRVNDSPPWLSVSTNVLTDSPVSVSPR